MKIKLSLSFTFLLSSLTYATSTSNYISGNYSLQMAYSTYTRQQGIITGTGGPSELLQSGILQKAFTKLVHQYPGDRYTSTYNEYLTDMINSAVFPVSDAQKDIGYPLDRFSLGNGLLNKFEETQDDKEKYSRAFQALHESIHLQPRNDQGGLWYYNVYSNWSYLDGMYSFAPFYVPYAVKHENGNVTAILADVIKQFDLLWEHCRDNRTGLLVHGYDASKTAVWANPETGASPHVWGRSLGWYVMALVDTLEYLNIWAQSGMLSGDALVGWPDLQEKFKCLVDALVKNVDQPSGGWWQVIDEPGKEGNYIESSGTAMFVYSLFKGSRLGYLQDGTNATQKVDNKNASRYTDVAGKAYEMLVDRFVVKNGNGTLGWNGTVTVCSLNSTASYEYYVGQPLFYNSPLGIGAFILASLEYERFHNVTSDVPWTPLL
ncbi:cell wall glycosyl hydrolase [Moniliophthora roreri MCA 2997]|uniref:Cell wall glycosyl hydrolase n=1 Tax=Moniliophthora roreri (strain MCA 2997) TaxID=1381753 RepID=V2Y9N6_MONRO|nr:cell wall glycosyl hydrolase [Moniliophthora roreri MCA 2997]